MAESYSILMYHAVYRSEEERVALAAEDRPYALSLAEFRQHLEIIDGSGKKTCNAGQLVYEKLPADRSVVMTFDDGYADIASIIWPELVKNSQIATVFITAGKLDTPGFLSRTQVRELADNGLEIGSHGFSHRLFTSMDAAEGREELKHSKDVLQEVTNREIDLLSLPGGGLPRWLPDAAREAGYRLVFGSRPGYYGGIGMMVPRIPIRPGVTRSDLMNILKGQGGVVKKMLRGYRIRTLLHETMGDSLYFRLYKLVTRKRQ